MEQLLYDRHPHERPREKIQAHGVSSLSITELIQVLIGSGTAKLSAARISRDVASLLSAKTSGASYSDLLTIPGVGEATATRILAALQIGMYISTRQLGVKAKLDTHILTIAKRPLLIYATLRTGGSVIRFYTLKIKPSESSLVLSRKICAQVLADKGVAVTIALGFRNQKLELGAFETALLEDLRRISLELQLEIEAILLVNSNSQQPILGGFS